MIKEGQYTPSELREIVIFACTQYELMKLYPTRITKEFFGE
jgi:hypothetical protein